MYAIPPIVSMRMKLIDLTLDSPASNLAFDEALLDESEERESSEYLRTWESPEYFVVLGSSNGIHEEVNHDACRADAIPILRRHSGGGTVLQGPGCLSYCLILRMEGECSTITGTNSFVLERIRRALEPVVGQQVQVRGFTDLTIGSVKFSGNSQRRRLRHLMFHGTILNDFDLDRIERYLKLPSKQPSYRQNRAHREFLTNISGQPESIKGALAAAWNATIHAPALPLQRMRSLVRERYDSSEWIYRL